MQLGFCELWDSKPRLATSGEREQPQACGTGLSSLPWRFRNGGPHLVQCRKVTSYLPCLGASSRFGHVTGRQPCGFWSALLGDFRGLLSTFTDGWLEKVLCDHAAPIPTYIHA